MIRMLALVIMVLTAGPIYAAEEEITHWVSLINLIATPEKYHQKKVAVIGVASLGHEDSTIWTSTEALEHRVSKNAVWVSFVGAQLNRNESRSELSGHYVIVEGVFNMDSKGHMGLFSGGIGNLTRYDAWRKPK